MRLYRNERGTLTIYKDDDINNLLNALHPIIVAVKKGERISVALEYMESRDWTMLESAIKALPDF